MCGENTQEQIITMALAFLRPDSKYFFFRGLNRNIRNQSYILGSIIALQSCTKVSNTEKIIFLIMIKESPEGTICVLLWLLRKL